MFVAELMLLGFISLTLAILRDPVSKICIRSSWYDKWTPCKISDRPNATSTSNSSAAISGQKLSTPRSWIPSDDGAAPLPHGRRLLAEATTSYTCPQVHVIATPIHLIRTTGWQLSVARTHRVTVFRAWFGAAKPFLRSMLWELLSLYNHF